MAITQPPKKGSTGPRKTKSLGTPREKQLVEDVHRKAMRKADVTFDRIAARIADDPAAYEERYSQHLADLMQELDETDTERNPTPSSSASCAAGSSTDLRLPGTDISMVGLSSPTAFFRGHPSTAYQKRLSYVGRIRMHSSVKFAFLLQLSERLYLPLLVRKGSSLYDEKAFAKVKDGDLYHFDGVLRAQLHHNPCVAFDAQSTHKRLGSATFEDIVKLNVQLDRNMYPPGGFSHAGGAVAYGNGSSAPQTADSTASRAVDAESDDVDAAFHAACDEMTFSDSDSDSDSWQ